MNRINVTLLLLVYCMIATGQGASTSAWYQIDLIDKPSEAPLPADAQRLRDDFLRLQKVVNAEELFNAKYSRNLHTMSSRSSVTSFAQQFAADSAAFVHTHGRGTFNNLIRGQYDRYLQGSSITPYYGMMVHALSQDLKWSEDDRRVLGLALEHFLAEGDLHSAFTVAFFIDRPKGKKLEPSLITGSGVLTAYVGYLLRHAGFVSETYPDGEHRKPITEAEIRQLFERKLNSERNDVNANLLAPGLNAMTGSAEGSIALPCVFEQGMQNGALTVDAGERYLKLVVCKTIMEMGAGGGTQALKPVMKHKRSRLVLKAFLDYYRSAALCTFMVGHVKWISEVDRALFGGNGEPEMLLYSGEDWGGMEMLILAELQGTLVKDTLTTRLLSAPWEQPSDWRALRDCGAYCERIGRLGTAARFYGLAVRNFPSNLPKDTLATIRAHELACSFFAKQRGAVPEPLNAYPPGSRPIRLHSGLLVTMLDDKLLVADVIEGSAAQAAGVQPGDRIIVINADSVTTDKGAAYWAGRLTNVSAGWHVGLKLARLDSPVPFYCNFLPNYLPPRLSGEAGNEADRKQLVESGKGLDYGAGQELTRSQLERNDLSALDTTFKQARLWPSVAQNAALLQRVNRCLEVINRMVKEPVGGQTFRDVDMTLGLVAVLAQIVRESKASSQQLGRLEGTAGVLSELAENPKASEEAEAIVPAPGPASSSSTGVQLEGGGSIVEAGPAVNISGRYVCESTNQHTTFSDGRTQTSTECNDEESGGNAGASIGGSRYQAPLNIPASAWSMTREHHIVQNGTAIEFITKQRNEFHSETVNKSSESVYTWNGTVQGDVVTFRTVDCKGECAGFGTLRSEYSTNQMIIGEHGVVTWDMVCTFSNGQRSDSHTSYRRVGD